MHFFIFILWNFQKKEYQIFPKNIFLQAMGKLDASGLMVQKCVNKIGLNVFWIGFSSTFVWISCWVRGLSQIIKIQKINSIFLHFCDIHRVFSMFILQMRRNVNKFAFFSNLHIIHVHFLRRWSHIAYNSCKKSYTATLLVVSFSNEVKMDSFVYWKLNI